MLIVIATLCFTFTACSDDEPEESSLVGKWIGHQEKYPERECFIYTFKADGTGIAKWENGNRTDHIKKYKIKNNHLLIMWEGDDEYDNKGTIEIGKKSFRLDMYDEDNWWKFVKEK